MEKAVPPPALPPADEPDLTGKVVGDFRVLRRIGKGGMGQVFLAEQLSLKRPVALKIMRPDLAANATALRRFQLEAEAVARINHANIVQVYHYGVADGMHYMALEYVEGKNLREYLSKKGSPDLLIGLSILRQVAAALQRASEMGIVHRDIKPENILLTRKGEVKVTDFGLSRCLVGAEQQAANLTQSGVAMGTPLYMSPEQVQGKETDPRTDIYSLGVTCYHMFAGHPPFRGASAIEVAIQHVQNTPVPLADIRPDLPTELCHLVHKMMARDPAERYQSAGELLQDLTRLRAGLSGAGALRTQGFSLSQIALGAPASSVKLATAPTLAVPRPSRRRVWLAAAVVLSLALAAAGGGLLHWWRDRAAAAGPAPTGAEPPGDVTAVRAPARPDPREAALLEAVRKPADPRNLEEHRRYVDQLVQLGALYVEQRRLDEADKYFKGLQQKLDRAVRAVGRIGQAVVLAYRDQAKQSVEMFTEMEKKTEPPEHFLLQFRPGLRRLVAEALNRDAANLAPEPLPEALEKLRKLPAPPRPPEK